MSEGKKRTPIVFDLAVEENEVNPLDTLDVKDGKKEAGRAGKKPLKEVGKGNKQNGPKKAGQGPKKAGQMARNKPAMHKDMSHLSAFGGGGGGGPDLVVLDDADDDDAPAFGFGGGGSAADDDDDAPAFAFSSAPGKDVEKVMKMQAEKAEVQKGMQKANAISNKIQQRKENQKEAKIQKVSQKIQERRKENSKLEKVSQKIQERKKEQERKQEQDRKRHQQDNKKPPVKTGRNDSSYGQKSRSEPSSGVKKNTKPLHPFGNNKGGRGDSRQDSRNGSRGGQGHDRSYDKGYDKSRRPKLSEWTSNLPNFAPPPVMGSRDPWGSSDVPNLPMPVPNMPSGLQGQVQGQGFPQQQQQAFGAQVMNQMSMSNDFRNAASRNNFQGPPGPIPGPEGPNPFQGGPQGPNQFGGNFQGGPNQFGGGNNFNGMGPQGGGGQFQQQQMPPQQQMPQMQQPPMQRPQQQQTGGGSQMMNDFQRAAQQPPSQAGAQGVALGGVDLERAARMDPTEMLKYIQQCSHVYAKELDKRFPDVRKVMGRLVKTAVSDQFPDRVYVPCDKYNQLGDDCGTPFVYQDARGNWRIHACTICYFTMGGMINLHRQTRCPLLSLLKTSPANRS